uniref:Uncharacterized protein n=1 Tax=Odontella aurita TaxID=265563 RepID=A0A7S4MMD3_9STRA|mmetsp:Transcript_25808/g.76235  ORF Transcript_25808/g.76235 Transcript_25808/m.76235 type:complete len:686 (+) Transcript_25808:139-2196(+)
MGFSFSDPIFAALAAAITLVLAVFVHSVMRPSSKKREIVDKSTREMGNLIDTGGWEDDKDEEDDEVFEVEQEMEPLTQAAAAVAEGQGLGGGAMTDSATIAAINSSWGDKDDNAVKKQREADEAAAAEQQAEEDEDDETEEEGPFKIGDRVVMAGLKKAAHLNGRHGIISGRSRDHRYPVDLDLMDPPTKTNRISVKADNLKAEATIDFDEGYRAAVKDGHLEERHGQVVAFIFDTMQCLVAAQFLGDPSLGTLSDLYKFRQSGGPQAMAKCNALQGSAWSLWTDPGPFAPRTQGKSVYDRLKYTLQQSVVEQNGGVDKLDAKHPGGYRLIFDAMDDAKAAGGWQVRLHGTFWVVGLDEDGQGTYIVPDNNRSAVYRIVGHRAALQIKDPKPPSLFRMTLVPWYGRIVWDGSLETTRQGPPVAATPEMAERLRKSVERAKRQGRVIDRLAQLELPDGSRKGVQAPPLRIRPNANGGPGVPGMMGPKAGFEPPGKRGPPKPQPEPTDQEKKLIAKIATLPPVPCRDPRTFGPQNPPTLKEREGHWVLQRKGFTKAMNPKGEGVVLKGVGVGGGTPTPIGSFICRDVEKPTSVELLVALATLAVKEKKRPSMVGVDEMEVAERLGFLFKDIPQTVVFAFVQKGPGQGGGPGGPGGPPNAMQRAAMQQRMAAMVQQRQRANGSAGPQQ